MSSQITKGAAIQPRLGGRLIDARADSVPYPGRLPGDWPTDPERLLIRWSYQASADDRHHCTWAAAAFVLANEK